MDIDDDTLVEGLTALVGAMESTGFARIDGPQPTWRRARSNDDATETLDRVVLWRHPRQAHLHGYVASTAVEHMVHLRLFDPAWRPARLLPGYLDKGWPFDSIDQLRVIASTLAATLWPRAMLWFEQPDAPEVLLLAAGRVPSVVEPGPMLERHRARAAWLHAQGQHAEADYVEGVVHEIEALFAQADADSET